MTTAAIMTAMETILLTTKDDANNNYFTNTAEVKAVDMGSYQMLDKGVNYAAMAVLLFMAAEFALVVSNPTPTARGHAADCAV